MGDAHLKRLVLVIALVGAVTIGAGAVYLIARPPSTMPEPAAPAVGPPAMANSVPVGAPSSTQPNTSWTPQATEPTITWSVPKLAQTMFPGTTSTLTVRFSSNRDLVNVAVWVTPSLKNLVATSPSTFSSIAANQDYQLAVTLSAPQVFENGTFGGTIHLRSADNSATTYASP